jgi:hypothetical protein
MVDSLGMLVMFRAVTLVVEFESLVVLVNTAVMFPNIVFVIARRTIPGVMDALGFVAPGVSALDTDLELGAAVEVGSVRSVLPTAVDVVRISGVEFWVVDLMD